MAERPEETLDLFRWDADSGIGDCEADIEFAGLRARATLHRNNHFPLPSEFDGIADEIDEDLLKPRHIALDVRGQIRIDVRLQLQSFLCSDGSEEFHRVLDTSAEMVRMVFDLNFPRLDLRHVEDVVDNREQGFAGTADNLDEIALLICQCRVEQERSHADNPIHGGANLVTRVG